ncbi:MAG: hypothetical protein HY246_16665 [Proteobacteria bacterium]|nr:hypothetical protein [Pseudomonadota bacterium]
MSKALKIEPGTSTQEVERIRDLMKGRALPAGVKNYEIELGEDSTGQPAMWIWFLVESSFQPTKETLDRLNDLARSFKATIFKAGIDRVPYVRLRSTDGKKAPAA